nr:SPASM domain-containing protein [Parabacteroides goldsteinii]
MKGNILEIIKKNIQQKYIDSPYKELKMSFFGGEPLKNFKVVKDMLVFCKKFADEKKISLVADFTTNSTLITNRMLLFLKDFKCQFQITLDGDEERHNEIRFFKNNHKGTYKLVINNIYRIQESIPDSKTWIRINFDDRTLANFSKILNDLSSLDRTRNHLILRKVWQFPIEGISKDLIISALQLAMDHNFTIDYYTLPRFNVCFADRENEVLFNYDGKVFKCSTLESFDEEHTEGKVNEETGRVEWNINKISKNMLQRSPDRCLKCKIFPVCLGPCSKNSTQGDNFSCMVDEIGLSMDEFIFFCFKQEQNQKKIFKEIEV